MQRIHIPRPGDLVCVRRRTWRVRTVRSFDDCDLVALVPAGGRDRREQRFLAPFDSIDQVHAGGKPRLVPARRWRNAFRSVLTTATPPGGLRSALAAKIDLLPHQLEPALAVVRGLGSRLLLADAVGLGKTIQAGLVLAELRTRGWADRAIVLTPAGLRDQWATELAQRFDIDAVIVDSYELRRRGAELAVGVNPWATIPVAITSIDFVKRPEVLASVVACRWDVVIVDEAHNAASVSDRHDAIDTLGGRAAYVILMTATPHHGDRQQFRSLCAAGAHGDRIIAFRRTRREVGLGARRSVHVLAIRPSAAERRMHAAVARLTQSVLDAAADREREGLWLALSVLTKRALSSARSLSTTVERRLAVISDPAADPWQPALPLGDADGDTDGADEAPPLATPLFRDAGREREALRAIAEAAQAAARDESKIAALARLLRRLAEPVVVFTEYRDTLLHLQAAIREASAALHGGLTRQERTVALRSFVAGGCRVLFATDAAGEGLNLHERCRTVVNFELPWNPMRLEQRIGRVDRIGQRRRVHAIHFVARGTSEVDILERLRARVADANADIPSANPFENDERSIARVADGVSSEPVAAVTSVDGQIESSSPMEVVSLRDEAALEVERLRGLRGIGCPGCRAAPPDLDPERAWIAFARPPATRRALGGRAVMLVRVTAENATGELIEKSIVAVSIDWPRAVDCETAAAFVLALEPEIARQVEIAACRWRERVQSMHEAWLGSRLQRERAIAAALAVAATPVQPGLFDRRAERCHAEQAAAAAAAVDVSRSAVRRLEAESAISWPRPSIVLVLAPSR